MNHFIEHLLLSWLIKMLTIKLCTAFVHESQVLTTAKYGGIKEVSKFFCRI